MAALEFMASLMFVAFLLMFVFPFFSGCFGLLFILFFLGLFVVFFSLNFSWIILLGLVLYGFSLFKKYDRWRNLPDMANYLHVHPGCKLPVGVACYNCHSENLEHIGLFYKFSKYRFYICRACGSNLFRFKVL